MRLSVRVSKLLQSFLLSSVIALFFFVLLPSSVHAETQYTGPTTTTSHPVNEYIKPNVDEDVPQNQHTFVQSIFIEVLSTLVCQIAGVDPVDPTVPCLGINSETNKIGYVSAPHGDPNAPQVGGALGLLSSSIGGLYTQSVSTADYNRYLASNFGVVKTANAQTNEPGYGFEGLTPVLKIWTVTRNIAYFLLIIAFIFIGLGIMLRIKIDPRTVMTIQNQIPRIVVCILLITFSYSIAALMVDLMWVTTYAGVNALTSAHDPTVQAAKDGDNCNANPKKLSDVASRFLLQTPITYFNQVFSECQNEGTDVDGGIAAITSGVSLAVGSLASQVADSLFPEDPGDECSINPLSFDLGTCIKRAVRNVVDNIATILVYLVVLCTVLIALFRVWFNLIKAYIFTLIYIIMAPFWIVFGILPQKPLGFEVWLRSLFANLAIFPATAFLFVGARILKDLYNDDKTQPVAMGIQQAQQVLGASDPSGSVLAAKDFFIPPLAGHPLAPDFGALIAFGAILAAPSLQGLIRDKLKVPNAGSGKIMAAGLVAGAATAAAIPRRQIASMTRRNSQTGAGEGIVSHSMDQLTQGLLRSKAIKKIPGVGKLMGNLADKRENKWGGKGFRTNEERNLASEAAQSGMNPGEIKRLAKAENMKSEDYIGIRQSARDMAQREGKTFSDALEQQLESKRSNKSVPQLQQEAMQNNLSLNDYIKERKGARKAANDAGGDDDTRARNFENNLRQRLSNIMGKVTLVTNVPSLGDLKSQEMSGTTPRIHFNTLLDQSKRAGKLTDSDEPLVQRMRNTLADRQWSVKQFGEMEDEHKQEYINWLARSTEKAKGES